MGSVFSPLALVPTHGIRLWLSLATSTTLKGKENPRYLTTTHQAHVAAAAYQVLVASRVFQQGQDTMGKQKRIEKEAARAPSSPEKPPSSPEKPQAAPPATDKGTAAPPRPSLKARLLPEGGLLPWWVGLVISVYVLLQLGSALEHPCGVLGT